MNGNEDNGGEEERKHFSEFICRWRRRHGIKEEREKLQMSKSILFTF